MKKILYFIVILLMCLFVSVEISAATNLTNNKVKVNYNKTTKQLEAYGYNKQGNLGTGNNNDVGIDDKVNINSKIGNQKIIDYVFTDSQTYLLTDTGRVYASGYKIGDGKNNIRNTFRELKLYNASKVRVTSFKVLFNYNNCNEVSDSKAICDLGIRFNTNNKKIHYSFRNSGVIYSKELRIGGWNHTYLFYEYRYESPYANYIKYNESTGKKKTYEAYFNAERKKLIAVQLDKNKKTIKKMFYKKGIINSSKYMSANRTILTTYKKGIINRKTVNKYKDKKSEYIDLDNVYNRYVTNQTIYYYKDGKVKQRVVKKFSNKKLRLVSKKYYYKNKKGESYSIIKFYRNGKVYKQNKYLYNNKGKISKIIKLKKI